MLDRAPDWNRLVAAHEWAAELVPRIRQRVVEPLLPTGPPAWADDPGFDLSYHLRRRTLGPGTDLAAVLDTAQSLVLTPFDRQRPLWEATGRSPTGLPWCCEVGIVDRAARRALDEIAVMANAPDGLPDVVLMDLLMPGMDGIACTAELIHRRREAQAVAPRWSRWRRRRLCNCLDHEAPSRPR